MKLAKIIVDVPLMQTDKPYSYAIPEEFAGMLTAGMRAGKSPDSGDCGRL